MKKYIVGTVMTVAMLFASVASAEFVVGVQGGNAQVGIDEDELEGSELTCESSTCDNGSDFGFGFYAQLLGNTQAGNAFGIHIGHSSYSLEYDVESIDVEYDADVFDVLGIFRWKGSSASSFFVMGGYSEYDADGLEVGGVRYEGTDDGSGYKLVGGWDVGKGPVVFSPAVSYADYGDGRTATVLRIGIGYKFN